MVLNYQNFDFNVLKAMISELEKDQTENSLYISHRLTDEGVREWPNILREAF